MTKPATTPMTNSHLWPTRYMEEGMQNFITKLKYTAPQLWINVVLVTRLGGLGSCVISIAVQLFKGQGR